MANYTKLYIIGNGFDIHHNIPCSYRNYLSWLKENEKNTYDKIIDIYGDDATKIEWWNEFETNLGYFDIRTMIENASLNNQPSDEDIEKMRAFDTMGGAWDIENILGGMIDGVKESFHKWIDTLPKASEGKKIKLETQDAFFINFNYTLTLEDMYNVDKKDIWHIHGSINNDEYIIGHGRSINEVEEDASAYLAPYDGKEDPSEYGLDVMDDEITNNTKEEAVEQVMNLSKPVQKILSNNNDKFLLFKNVTEVYIYGISFSKVDSPYLEKILSSISSGAQFVVNYYNKKDSDNINTFFSHHKINYSLVQLEDLQLVKQLKLF